MAHGHMHTHARILSHLRRLSCRVQAHTQHVAIAAEPPELGSASMLLVSGLAQGPQLTGCLQLWALELLGPHCCQPLIYALLQQALLN